MLIYLVELSDEIPVLNLFRYITTRCAIAIVAALLITMFLSARIKRSGKDAGAEGGRSGGLALWSFLIAAFLAGDLSNLFCFVALFATSCVGLLGWASQKFEDRRFIHVAIPAMVIMIAFVTALAILFIHRSWISQPGETSIWFDMALITANAALIVCSTYCVKFAGDIDDNVVITSVLMSVPYILVVYLVGNAVFSNYLQLRFTPGMGEYAVLVAALVGSGIGIMWFTSSLPRFQIGVGTRFAFGVFIGIAAVSTHFQVIHAIAIAILAIEPLSIYLGFRRSKGLRRRILGLAPFINGRNGKA